MEVTINDDKPRPEQYNINELEGLGETSVTQYQVWTRAGCHKITLDRAKAEAELTRMQGFGLDGWIKTVEVKPGMDSWPVSMFP